jgi:5-methyltetrahydropteroyltriglutamate--homocysteine methyltransferase
VAQAEKAIQLFGAEPLLLTPDCGFATFADNPLNSERVAEAKLAALAQATQILRERHHIA